MNKDFILSEIRRTADSNGKPLGQVGFEKLTGVKKSAWYGIYWSKWGDALTEAGFHPNQFQVAYDENALILKFIEFMYELGRFPTPGEIGLKQKQDTNFPCNTTIFRKFGNKLKLAKRIAHFCQGKDDYADIESLCLNVIENQSKKKIEEVDISHNTDEVLGCVYLIKSGKYYKIGRSNSIGRRTYELAIQLPEKTNTIHSITTDDPTGIEAYWHKRFSHRRKNGEWFELTYPDVKAFKRRNFM